MKRVLSFVVSAIASAVFILMPGVTTYAQSNALSINPRRDFTINPGESISDKLTVSNTNTTEPLQLNIDIIDFSSENETGSPALVIDTKASPTAWSIRPYTKIPQQLTLEKGKSTDIPISISMPSGIGAGSYYGAIMYSVSNAGDPSKVNVLATGVTLIFVTVPGTAKELLTFKQFGTFIPTDDNSKGTFSGLFIDKQPKVLSYKVTNEGNLNQEPKGSMIVKDMFGKVINRIPSANPRKQLALLGQTRRFDACIKGKAVITKTPGGTEVSTEECVNPDLKPGRYTAQLSLLYGQLGGETREITAATSFWYLPWWFLAVVLGVLGLVAGFITFVVFKIRDFKAGGKRRKR